MGAMILREDVDNSSWIAQVTSITTVRDGIEKGAVVVHPDTTQRPLVGDSESYFDQFKSFAASRGLAANQRIGKCVLRVSKSNA